jgi:hypothetical protein
MKNRSVIDQEKIQIDLIKLVGGGRLLRLTEPHSGLVLEKKLDPAESVATQKRKMCGIFEAALARAELAAA